MSPKPTLADLERWVRGARERWANIALQEDDPRRVATYTIYATGLHGAVLTLATLRRMGA